jgi:hypothetical protein
MNRWRTATAPAMAQVAAEPVHRVPVEVTREVLPEETERR